MEDAGAGAIVIYSLFQEELERDKREVHERMVQGTQSYPESLTYFPEPEDMTFADERYLEHVSKARKAVDIPIIASINGSSLGGWTDHAQKMEQAGADALELNVYWLPTDVTATGSEIEDRYLDVCTAVREAVKIPVAVKLVPFFSNIANMAYRLANCGMDGLVLFNRLYQPDLKPEALEIEQKINLSTSADALLPLTWIGILHGQVAADLAATGGVHEAEDAVKLIMAGACVTMMCSSLLKNGIDHLAKVEKDLRAWMEANEYKNIHDMRGAMNYRHAPDPDAYERALYVDNILRYMPAGTD
jgi:dihydroorotate dehydrogenase (fumarate)